MLPHVDLDDHVDLRARVGRRRRQLARIDDALDRDDHAAESGDPCQLGSLDRADRLVRDQHVREPRIDQSGGFPDGRRREADRSGVQLHLADDGALVDLGVRSQRGRQTGHATCHLGDVPLDRAQVEDESRSHRFVTRTADHLPRVVQSIHSGHPVRSRGRRHAPSAPGRWAASATVSGRSEVI